MAILFYPKSDSAPIVGGAFPDPNSILIEKFPDKKYADIEEFIIYTITATNLGDIPVEDIIITDEIPYGIAFVPGSITSNMDYSGDNPSLGLSIINQIEPNETLIITYKVLVGSKIPSPNPIDIIINHADLNSLQNFTKTADKEYIDIGEFITYTLNIKNTGNVPANNIMINDSIILGMEFVPNSITSDVDFLGDDINEGILLTNPIFPDESATINFRVKLISKPATNPIESTSTLSYDYTIDPDISNYGLGSSMATDSTPIYNHGEIGSATLSSNKINSTPGDFILYTVCITNTGSVDINNITLKNPIPNGCEFIQESLVLKGNSYTPKYSYNRKSPFKKNFTINEINIETVPKETTLKVLFMVKVLSTTSTPIKNKISIDYSYIKKPDNQQIENSISTNGLSINILNAGILVIESADKDIAVVGDTIRFMIEVTNIQEIDLSKLIIKNLLPKELVFKGNLIINGVLSRQNIDTGINIESLPIDKTLVISFDALVSGFPTNGVITTLSTFKFGYIVDKVLFSKVNQGNIVSVDIYNPSLLITKSANRKNLSFRDRVTYTAKLTNNGNIDVENVIFYDKLPFGSKLVDYSLKINGVTLKKINLDLALGISIGNISIGVSDTIEYTVELIHPSMSMKLTSSAYADFNYYLPNKEFGIINMKPTIESTSTLDINITNFREIKISDEFKLLPKSPDIKHVSNIIGNIEINTSYVIQVPSINNFKDNNIKQYKLIIRGIFKLEVYYKSVDEGQNTYKSNFIVPFETFIILPNSYNFGQDIETDTFIENISYNISGSKKLSIDSIGFIYINVVNYKL
ncbi:MAG: hypothetical protein RSD22_09285 [Romboutsia sp.]